MKSTKKKIKETQNTWCGMLTCAVLKNERNDIDVGPPDGYASIQLLNTTENLNYNAYTEINSYFISTRMQAYYDNRKKDELTEDDRLLYCDYKKDFRDTKSAFGCSSTGNGQKYMVYIVYEDIKSKNPTFYVHKIKN
tara:strand:- start:106 stop:516 length:411 start_codon:yes stop_codon:yes gene_type:complete